MPPYSYSSKRRTRNSARFGLALGAILALIAVRMLTGSSRPAQGLADVDRSLSTLGLADSNQPDPAPIAAAQENPIVTPTLARNPLPLSRAEAEDLIPELSSYLNASAPDIINARDRLNELLSGPLDDRQLNYVKDQLANLSPQWLFSANVLAGDKLCAEYKVQTGDTFGHLQQQFKVPYETLMRINNIKDPHALRADRTIKVINGPFHCRLYRSSSTLDLFLQQTFIRTFTITDAENAAELPIAKYFTNPSPQPPIRLSADDARCLQDLLLPRASQLTIIE